MGQPFGWLFVLAGGFAICGAVCNWDWFMNHRKARFLCSLITRTGARIFYTVLGTLLVVLGVLAAFGVIDMSQS